MRGWRSVTGCVAAVGAVIALGGGAMAADAGDGFDAADLLAKAPQIEETSFWYLRADAGYVFNEAPGVGSTLGDSGLVGIGVGARFSDWLRLDLTADYRTQADYDGYGVSGDASTATILANAYVDLGRWQKLTPYVGAGIGTAYVDVDAPGVGSGWGLAWGLMGGVALDLAPNWQLDLGYRYLKIEDVSLGAGLPAFDQAAHEVRLGVRFLID